MSRREEEPNLAEDEARLAALSDDLLGRLLAAIPPWIRRTVDRRAAEAGIDLERAGQDRIMAVADGVAAGLKEPLAALFSADVDAGAGSPLAVLRSAVGPVNDLLDELGVPERTRDEFAASHFPNDRHDVGPPAFADVDPSLHEPGIMWGAARAHIHLRRRREVQT